MPELQNWFTPEQRIELKEIIREGMENARFNGYEQLAWKDDALDAAQDMFDFYPSIEEFMTKHSLDPDGYVGSCANIIEEIRRGE